MNTFAISNYLTDFYAFHRDMTSEAHPIPVHERQHVVIALDLLRPLRNILFVIEPALGHEGFGIWAPECVGQINGTKRNVDLCSFGDKYTLQQLACLSYYWRVER